MRCLSRCVCVHLKRIYYNPGVESVDTEISATDNPVVYRKLNRNSTTFCVYFTFAGHNEELCAYSIPFSATRWLLFVYWLSGVLISQTQLQSSTHNYLFEDRVSLEKFHPNFIPVEPVGKAVHSTIYLSCNSFKVFKVVAFFYRLTNLNVISKCV